MISDLIHVHVNALRDLYASISNTACSITAIVCISHHIKVVVHTASVLEAWKSKVTSIRVYRLVNNDRASTRLFVFNTTFHEGKRANLVKDTIASTQISLFFLLWRLLLHKLSCRI